MIPIKDNIPNDRFPLATVGLILLSVVGYVLACAHGGSLISGPDLAVTVKFGAIPYVLTHSGQHCVVIDGTTAVSCGHVAGALPAWETVFTAIFMHASIVHLAVDMLFLWIFGNTVEDSMGSLLFVGFYLAGGVAALALHVLVDPNSVAPTFAAAGAIAAVVGGYIVLYPRGRVLTLTLIPFFSTVIELPALVMLVLWFAAQAAFGAAGLTDPAGGGGGVAYFAHVGGFAFGLATIRLLARRRKPTPPTAAAYR